jgi:peptide/nickel transport system permease protein
VSVEEVPTETGTASPGLENLPEPVRSRRERTGSGVSVLILRRLRDGLITLALVVAIIFTLTNFVGDPALVYAPVDASDEEIERIEEAFGLDRPFPERFVEYFGDVFTGDLGESYWQKRPALDAVREALPNTIQLTLVGILGAAVLGIVGGILAGSRPGSIVDRVSNFLSVVALSVPNFWLGLLLIIVFAVKLGWFPTSGKFGWESIVLPALTVAIVHGGRIFQLVRSATVEEMSKPYVRVARSKGFPHRVVLWRHVLRNTGLTTATIAGWEYVRLWGGAVFAVEFVFAWPGIGTLMINAAHRQDFFVLQAAVIVAGAFVIFSNLVVDLMYRAIDNRVKAA